ncbi:tetratricopeptide repeat protein [Planktothrix agardhii]|uniref:tetratricopeptide repeat protein n=1 Tax=Planktothrix agardhii TaxID=1160 RepID=UPI001D0B3001|nr:tetratricopeptide repeat protein [Planktothrix agardhii]MCB8762358.1 tetratricopeptide repeat protein [Planktothrix agardhii 1809]MCB8780479.1 tetratricopeptide repeat protein [Planktothrix agardhii 1808]MCF3568330.1 tetratricopeptide repeat protein [Planktothrix agardhii 1807]
MVIQQQPSSLSDRPQVSSMVKSRRRSVSPAEPSYRLAQALVKQEKWQEAIAAYQQALIITPNWVEVQRELGDLFLKLERWDEAVQVYETAIGLRSEGAEVYHNLGDALLKLQRWEDAIAAYEKAIELNPEFSWSYNNLGDGLRELQRWDEAAQAYRKAIELKPDFALSHHNLGDILVKKEDWENAIAAYQKAVDLDPNFVWAHYNLAEVYVKLDQWDEAVEAYRQVLKIKPDLAIAYQKLADIAQNRIQLYFNELIGYYCSLIDINPYDKELSNNLDKTILDQSELFFQIGNNLLKHNKLEDGINWYKKCFKIDFYKNQTSDIFFLTIIILYKALERRPNIPEIYFYLAQKLLESDQNKINQAVIFYQLAIELKPDYAEAYFQLGHTLEKQNYYEQAISCYRQAIQLIPNCCWYYNSLGDLLLNMGEAEEAGSAYNRAIELYPEYQDFYLKHSKAINQYSRFDQLKKYCDDYSNQKLAKITSKNPSLRILMLTAYPPYPPKSGAPIRMFEQIKYLGKKHRVTVVSFIFSEDDYQIEKELENHCDKAIMVMLGTPISPRQPHEQKQVWHWNTWTMRKVINQLKNIDFDLVLFDFIYMGCYRDCFPNSFTVLQEHNIESMILARCAEISKENSELEKIAEQVEAVKSFLDAKTEAKLLEEYETKTWPKFNLVTTVSEIDRLEIIKCCPTCETWVVENGVNTKTILPVNNQNTRKILFMGGLAYYPNIDGVCYFVKEILPKIWERDETITFCIAGREPSSIIEQMSGDPRIEILANPDDMSEVAKECIMTVVPLRIGGGTRLKIPHAMAMGLPVVSTHLGCEGLSVTDGVNILIRDDPNLFADAVLQIFNDTSLWQRLRLNGRQLVEQKYDWESIFSEYERNLLSQIKR